MANSMRTFYKSQQLPTFSLQIHHLIFDSSNYFATSLPRSFDKISQYRVGTRVRRRTTQPKSTQATPRYHSHRKQQHKQPSRENQQSVLVYSQPKINRQRINRIHAVLALAELRFLSLAAGSGKEKARLGLALV